jgi:hypothetical protein
MRELNGFLKERGKSMVELNESDIVFFDLYKTGYRFIGPEDENDLNSSLSVELSPGIYQTLTIQGMKRLAKDGKITLDGEPLTEEEIELFWNALAFIVNNKGKVTRSINK